MGYFLGGTPSATVHIQCRTPLKGVICLTLAVTNGDYRSNKRRSRRRRLALKQNLVLCTCEPFNLRQQHEQTDFGRSASGHGRDDRAVRGGNEGKAAHFERTNACNMPY
jgi:hypothetical protein